MYPILTIQRTRVTHLLIGMQLLMVYILLKADMPIKTKSSSVAMFNQQSRVD
jgi:hypothetical protein